MLKFGRWISLKCTPLPGISMFSEEKGDFVFSVNTDNMTKWFWIFGKYIASVRCKCWFSIDFLFFLWMKKHSRWSITSNEMRRFQFTFSFKEIVFQHMRYRSYISLFLEWKRKFWLWVSRFQNKFNTFGKAETCLPSSRDDVVAVTMDEILIFSFVIQFDGSSFFFVVVQLKDLCMLWCAL